MATGASSLFSNQNLVEAVDFINGEIVRFDEIIRSGRLGELDPMDAFSEVRREGEGMVICGRAAGRKLWYLAEAALHGSVYKHRLSVEAVVKRLRHIYVERLLLSGEISSQTVRKTLSTAVRFAAKDCADRTHFIAAHLMRLREPTHFSMGPVKFHPRPQFSEHLFSNYVDEFVERDSQRAKKTPGESRDWIGKMHSYYEAFEWVAEVSVVGCDSSVSKARAFRAAFAALNLIHLLGEDRNTRRMAVGGDKLTEFNKVHLWLEDDKLDWEFSRALPGELGFEGWDDWLKQPVNDHLVQTAGECIRSVCEPELNRPVAERWLDAASWFGEGVRDRTDASAIVKFVTAIERMVMTGEKGDAVHGIFCARSAGLAFQPDSTSYDELHREAANVYDVRSKLVHGSMSPFDPELGTDRYRAASFARKVLLGAINAMGGFGLVDKNLTRQQLGEAWDGITAEVIKDGGTRFFPTTRDPRVD